MLELSKAYELGLGVPADQEQAKAWRERATSKPEAQEKKSNAPSQRADPRNSKR